MENNIIIYQTQDGKTKIDVKIENETVWLTQNQMVELARQILANIFPIFSKKASWMKIQLLGISE